jgi:hypothetical protein
MVPPRSPTNWFWNTRSESRDTIHKVRHHLGPDKARARRRLHGPVTANAGEAPAPPVSNALAAVIIINEFLDPLRKLRVAGTQGWHHEQPFTTRGLAQMSRVVPGGVRLRRNPCPVKGRETDACPPSPAGNRSALRTPAVVIEPGNGTANVSHP